MHRLAFALIVPALVCPAQETNRVVFTLPKPQAYALPLTVQQIIMDAFKYCPEKAVLWRDEYKAIYKNKDDLKAWLDNTVMDACLQRAAHQELSDTYMKEVNRVGEIKMFIGSDRW